MPTSEENAHQTPRWFVIGCVLLIVAIAFTAMGFIKGDLTSDQRAIIRWAAALSSGFAAGAFIGSLRLKSERLVPKVALSASGGFGVWLLTFFFLFPTPDKATPPDTIFDNTVEVAIRWEPDLPGKPRYAMPNEPIIVEVQTANGDATPVGMTAGGVPQYMHTFVKKIPLVRDLEASVVIRKKLLLSGCRIGVVVRVNGCLLYDGTPHLGNMVGGGAEEVVVPFRSGAPCPPRACLVTFEFQLLSVKDTKGKAWIRLAYYVGPDAQERERTPRATAHTADQALGQVYETTKIPYPDPIDPASDRPVKVRVEGLLQDQEYYPDGSPGTQDVQPHLNILEKDLYRLIDNGWRDLKLGDWAGVTVRWRVTQTS